MEFQAWCRRVARTLTPCALLCLTAGAAAAQGDAMDVRQAKEARLEAFRKQTRTLRDLAASAYQADVAECQNRVLVNDCIGRAKQRRLSRVEEARKLEVEERSIERDIKRADLADRRARKARAMANRPLPEITTHPDAVEALGSAPVDM
jgi:hypothetical protein